MLAEEEAREEARFATIQPLHIDSCIMLIVETSLEILQRRRVVAQFDCRPPE
jgi:hypothetical protein